MQDEQEIIAETVNGGRFFFYLISFLLSGILLSFGLVTWLKNPLFALVALIFILPIFFQKRLIIFLTKQIMLIFNDDYFTITLSNCQSGEKINTQDYYYKDVSSCNVTFPQSKLAYSTIKINFVNNEN